MSNDPRSFARGVSDTTWEHGVSKEAWSSCRPTSVRRGPTLDERVASSSADRPAALRAVHAQAQILVLATTQDIDRLVGTAGAIAAIKTRLAELELQLLGRTSRSATLLAEQIVSWFETHDRDRAYKLMQAAVGDHASAAVLRNGGECLELGRTSSSVIASRLLGRA